jgi:hypothetical protein
MMLDWNEYLNELDWRNRRYATLSNAHPAKEDV